MRPFRKHVAIAVDGGGIKGVMVTRALSILEDYIGKSVGEVFRLAAGTSTGSIISAAIGAGMSAAKMHVLYCRLGSDVFRKGLRSRLWLLCKYRYPHGPLRRALNQYLGGFTMGAFWDRQRGTDVVITLFDLVQNRTRFVKSWKRKYKTWQAVEAVLGSCSIPTYFPPLAGRYVDGGVGSYANPCYIAAYELLYCLNWKPSETTLISLGTGRNPHTLRPGDANRFMAWQWLGPILGAFLKSADDQQVRLVETFFRKLDFRRFQIDFNEPIEADDANMIPVLTAYGDALGRKILRNETDWAVGITAKRAR
jgi:patatin-like phospholipase/acyl hydrolase